jgi:xanthine dehydrogenase accessory factor
VYIKPVVPVSHLVILVAGHMGKALSHIACFVGFRVTVVDDREEFANHENLPDADTIVVNKFDLAFSQIRVDSHTSIVVVTCGHNHDLEAVKAALKTEALYIGLVGSRRKKVFFLTIWNKRDFQRTLSIGS